MRTWMSLREQWRELVNHFTALPSVTPQDAATNESSGWHPYGASTEGGTALMNETVSAGA